MLGIRTLRRLHRKTTRTAKKVILVALMVSTGSVGGMQVHTDGALGREAAAFVTGLMNPAPRTP